MGKAMLIILVVTSAWVILSTHDLAAREIGYNGEYWLTAGTEEGSLLKFDGEELTQLVPQPGLFRAWVESIYWDRHNEYWLIAYRVGNESNPLGESYIEVYRFNGSSLEYMGSPNMWGVNRIAGNGEYWLLGGYEGKLVKFDGKAFTDLSKKANFSKSSIIRDLDWSPDGYWIIVGSDGVLRYDGSEFRDLTEEAGLKDAYIQDLAFNGSHWLITGYEAGGERPGKKKVVVYDGESFVDLTDEAGLEGIPYHAVWTGNRWVIGARSPYIGTGFLTYDGVMFNEIEEFRGLPTWFAGEGGKLLFAGQDRLVFYDGQGLKDLTVKAGFARITDVKWNPRGRYWLIAASNDDGSAGALMRYDGTTSKEVFSGGGMTSLGWNGDYWLIGGYGGRLMRYDGEKLKNLSGNAGLGEGYVSAIEWSLSEGYWLIGLNGDVSKALIRYDGEDFTDLTAQSGLRRVYHIAWGDRVWLISGELRLEKDKGPGHVLSYDGRSFTDVTKAVGFEREGSRRNIITFDYDSDGGYWLIGGSAGEMHPSTQFPVLLRYGGNTSRRLVDELGREIGDIENNRVYTVKWNGDYWLIYTARGKLLRYDGKTFHDLTTEETRWLRHEPNAIDWNGKYWLIGGRNGRLLRYDGEEFHRVDGAESVLTPPSRVVSVLNQGTEETPPKPSTLETRRGVCGPSVIILLALLLTLFPRRLAR